MTGLAAAADANGLRILVIEDTDRKWNDVRDELTALGASDIVRASTIEEAEGLIEESWNLVVLDISMDIRVSKSGPKEGGHDTTGGLKIASKMYYLGCEAPTIIVTAFDAFPSRLRGGKTGSVILGLEEVEARARQQLGEAFIACVKWNSPGWRAEFSEHVLKVAAR
jgi:hypothetical protein